MALRSILLHPDPRLRKVCAPVGRVTPDVERLAADMLATAAFVLGVDAGLALLESEGEAPGKPGRRA